MTQFKINGWGFHIQEMVITRKSESCIWYMHNGREHTADGKYYFNTWEEAKQALIDRETLDLQRAEKQVQYRQEELKKALAISR
jgi:hypothetical protein